MITSSEKQAEEPERNSEIKGEGVQERGAKGNLDTASPVGTLVGYAGGSYAILKPNGSVVHRAPHHVKALNEQVLLDRGLPSGGEPPPSTPEARDSGLV